MRCMLPIGLVRRRVAHAHGTSLKKTVVPQTGQKRNLNLAS